LRNVVKCGKYSLAKFVNFVYFCIACGNCYYFRPKLNVVGISAHNTKFANFASIQNLRTLQGYIFHILQHFTTKLCNFNNFSMYSMLFCGDLFASPCLVLKLVYNGNCLLVDQWPVTCRLTSWALQSGLSHGDEILHNYIICQVQTPPSHVPHVMLGKFGTCQMLIIWCHCGLFTANAI
jgi:hypothetical protein